MRAGGGGGGGDLLPRDKLIKMATFQGMEKETAAKLFDGADAALRSWWVVPARSARSSTRCGSSMPWAPLLCYVRFMLHSLPDTRELLQGDFHVVRRAVLAHVIYNVKRCGGGT